VHRNHRRLSGTFRFEAGTLTGDPRRLSDFPQALPLVPEHMVPLALHLAAQDAKALTGKMFDVVTWNEEHGLGNIDAWRDTSFSYEALRASIK